MFCQVNIDSSKTEEGKATRAILAILDKKGLNAEQTVTTALSSLERKEGECMRIVTPKLLKPQNEELVSSVAMGSVCLNKEPSIFDVGKGMLTFLGTIYSPSPAIAEKEIKEPEQAIEKMIREYEGDFAAIATDAEKIVAGRDPIGIQPLYYGENKSYSAIGSNRTILWKLGIQGTYSFPPGHIGILTKKCFKFRSVRKLAFSETKHSTMETAIDDLLRILEREVRMRAQNEDKIAVAFSGGLDSSLIAFLAKKHNTSVQLIHASLAGRRETNEAEKAAVALNLPLSVHLFPEEDVPKIAAKVVEIIEEPDPLKTAIGIPFYWVAQKTAQSGFRVLLAGQGADELFGGYQRYSNVCRLQGEEKARRMMFTDVARMHKINLERDQKICRFHNVELRLPFASFGMAEFALSLPLELKIDRNMGSERKMVLRRAAEKTGLPAWIARKPKKAIQYATGVSSTLEKIARKRRTTVGDFLDQVFSSVNKPDAEILG